LGLPSAKLWRRSGSAVSRKLIIDGKELDDDSHVVAGVKRRR
jgi:hypothetical protein